MYAVHRKKGRSLTLLGNQTLALFTRTVSKQLKALLHAQPYKWHAANSCPSKPLGGCLHMYHEAADDFVFSVDFMVDPSASQFACPAYIFSGENGRGNRSV